MSCTMYRYNVHWADFPDSRDYYNLLEYARKNFKFVLEGAGNLAFTTTPEEARRGLTELGINTGYVEILTSPDLTPNVTERPYKLRK